MASHEERRQAIRAYKEKEEIGGLFRIVNTKNGWQGPVQATPNLEGQKNRVQFAKRTNTCFDIGGDLPKQWAEFGPDAFEFIEIERLTRKADQTNVDFRDELKSLLELYESNSQP